MPRKKQITASTTKKATKTRKTKLAKQEIEFAHGKIEDEHKLSMDIEGILSPPKNPFGAKTTEDLEEKLEGLNLRQLQEMAVKASVFPSGNKTSLKNKLKKEFASKFGSKDSGGRYQNTVEKPIVEHDSKLAKDIIDILNGK